MATEKLKENFNVKEHHCQITASVAVWYKVDFTGDIGRTPLKYFLKTGVKLATSHKASGNFLLVKLFFCFFFVKNTCSVYVSVLAVTENCKISKLSNKFELKCAAWCWLNSTAEHTVGVLTW